MMKTWVYLGVCALSLTVSANAQSNTFIMNYTSDGFISAGKNRSIVKNPKALTKSYGEKSCPAPKFGEEIRMTYFIMPTDNKGEPVCNWSVLGVTNMGPIISNESWSAKTDGKFFKVTVAITNTSEHDSYLSKEFFFIQMYRSKDDLRGNPQLPHNDSDSFVCENEQLVRRSILPPGISRIYSLIYEVPLNVNGAVFHVFPTTCSDLAEYLRIRAKMDVKLW